MVFGWEFPASLFQSVNSVFLVLARAGADDAVAGASASASRPRPSKFAYGLLFMALGFLVVAGAALVSVRSGGAQGQPLVAGRRLPLPHHRRAVPLARSGLSTVSKLAPPRLVSMMLGVYFLSISLGNFIGGRIAGLFETFPLPQLFGAVFLTGLVSALVCSCWSSRSAS